jgi:beta-glucosidase
VTFRLGARDLSYWSSRHRRWVLEGGTFDLVVGSSSRDPRLVTTIDVPAPPLSTGLDAEATLREWLAHPDGAAALRNAVGVDPDGRPRGVLGDPETSKVLGDFPLRTLTTFPGLGIDRATVADLTRRFRHR